jgi:hypothetical protein
MHAALDTLRNLLAANITAANEQKMAQIAKLAEKLQEVAGGTVEKSA